MYYDPYKRSESNSAYKNRINSIDSTIIAYLITPCKRISFIYTDISQNPLPFCTISARRSILYVTWDFLSNQGRYAWLTCVSSLTVLPFRSFTDFAGRILRCSIVYRFLFESLTQEVQSKWLCHSTILFIVFDFCRFSEGLSYAKKCGSSFWY